MSIAVSQIAESIQTETLDLRELADLDLEQNLHLGLEQEESLFLTVGTGFGEATIFLTYEGFFTIVVRNQVTDEQVTLVEDVLFSHFPPNRTMQSHAW